MLTWMWVWVRNGAVCVPDGMAYGSTNTRDVDLGGGLEHKTGQDVADGRLGVSMATKHAEEGSISKFDIEQARRSGHSLDGDWKNTNGKAVNKWRIYAFPSGSSARHRNS